MSYGNQVVLNEAQLTRRLSAKDVHLTLEEFRARNTDNEISVQLVFQTTETSEARASRLLDLGEAALERLFGPETKYRVSVVTGQLDDKSQMNLTQSSIDYISKTTGISTMSSSEEIEDFVGSRCTTEFLLLSLIYSNTNLLPSPDLTITFPSGRILKAFRSQRFR